MVRGLAALLGLALAQAYVLATPELPRVEAADAALLAAGTAGVAAVWLSAAVVAPLSDERALPWLVALGAGMVTATLNAAGAGAAASPAEAVAYSAAGAAFAGALLTPSLALALPLFVALVDGGSSLLSGADGLLADRVGSGDGDALSLELGLWGGGLPAGHLAAAHAAFVGVFLVYARRFGLRPLATAAALGVALLAAFAVEVETGTAIPVLPLMAAGYFAVNADRLPALFRRTREG